MKLRLSSQARTDLDRIFSYTCAHFGEPKAVQYIDEIITALEQLKHFPRVGRRSHQLPPNRRALSIRSHYAIYTIEDDTIHVLRLLHERQLPDDA
ncbi:type II toxin-antitoxin system RelE/ParE family toxin [Maricaulis virginensis]|uniref:Toxin n=1 Tax=Maricaulis virginensis TaxID=144022 RepID=A0A9W6IJY8_9PROT|nr:type II toxin-antitoxin system RelE/ParE family toxin [Maricaulis virginensis]GLK51618.1 hypothetical protein GCM10017621_11260 [Maricaulis virginensis]